MGLGPRARPAGPKLTASMVRTLLVPFWKRRATRGTVPSTSCPRRKLPTFATNRRFRCSRFHGSNAVPESVERPAAWSGRGRALARGEHWPRARAPHARKARVSAHSCDGPWRRPRLQRRHSIIREGDDAGLTTRQDRGLPRGAAPLKGPEARAAPRGRHTSPRPISRNAFAKSLQVIEDTAAGNYLAEPGTKAIIRKALAGDGRTNVGK
jgi:hypothetical protein